MNPIHSGSALGIELSVDAGRVRRQASASTTIRWRADWGSL